MASFMAPIPRFFFCIVEPLLITYGSVVWLINPGQYSAAILGSSPPSPSSTYSPAEQLSSINSGTMTALVGLLAAIVMWTCKDPRTVRLVILALALADPPHWAGTIAVLDRSLLSDFGSWSTELKGHMLGPAFTFSFKMAYLLGLLGSDRLPEEAKGKTL